MELNKSKKRMDLSKLDLSKLEEKDIRDLLDHINKFAYGKNCFYNPIYAKGLINVAIPITSLIGYIDSNNEYHCKIEIKLKKKCKEKIRNQYLIITIGNKNDKNTDVLIHEIKLTAISDIHLSNFKQTRIYSKFQIESIIYNDMFDSLQFKIEFKLRNILFSSTYVPMEHLYKNKLIKELEDFRKSLIAKENCFLMEKNKYYKLKVTIKKSLLESIKYVYPEYDFNLSFIGRSCELNSGAYFSFCKLKDIENMDTEFKLDSDFIDCPIGEKYFSTLVIYNADILIVNSNKKYYITKEYNFKNDINDKDVFEIDLVFFSRAYCNYYAQKVINKEAKILQNDIDIILKAREKEEKEKRIEKKRKEIERNVARARTLLDKKEKEKAKEKAYKEAQEKEKEKREKCKEKRRRKKERKKEERKERKKQIQIKKAEEEKAIAEKQTREKAAKAKQKILEEKAKLIAALKSEQERKNKIAIKMAKKAAKKAFKKNVVKIQSIFRSFIAKKLLSKLKKNKILEDKQNNQIICQTLNFLILCIEQQDIINKNKIIIDKKHQESIDFEEKNEFDIEEQQIELEVESDENYIQEEVKNELIKYECGCWGPENGCCNDCDIQNQIYFQHQQFIPPPHILHPHMFPPYMPVYLQPQIPIYYQSLPYVNSEYIDNDFQKQGFNGQPYPPYPPYTPPPPGNQCISPA